MSRACPTTTCSRTGSCRRPTASPTPSGDWPPTDVKPVDIDLVPMTEAEYEAWLDGAVAEYAAEHVRSGNWSADESIARSAEQFQALLPNGVESSDQHIFTVRDRAGDRVGILWVATGRRPGHAFIYDIEMAEDRRGEGFGTAALVALEEW